MINKLFLRLALSILVIIILLAGVISWISIRTIDNYYTEANQKLHSSLAEYTAKEAYPYNANMELDTAVLQDVMHSMMVINPDVEIYLLDTAGGIQFHVAPYKRVVRENVNLNPIKEFIAQEGATSILGDDPRDHEGQKIFSAASITSNDGHKVGYYYIILASQERESILHSLWNTYAFKSGSFLFIISILSAILLAILLIWLITKNLNPVLHAMEAFRNGKYEERIKKPTGVFSGLSEMYNKMASKIQESIDKIRSVDNFRKELIANVSHDLRTPLSVVQGYSETLLMKKDTISKEDQNKYLHNIHENTLRMGGLINQLFELSKLEGNQIELHKEVFSLHELVRDTLERFQLLLEKKKIKVNIDAEQSLPLAFGDIALVERVIQNLLDNAVKFSDPESEIDIILKSNDQKLSFAISDHGEGIEDSKLETIFDRYMTKDKSKTKSKGTGLGLAIAKKIMELHGSGINVESKVNVGTTFSFNLQHVSV